VLRFRDKRFVNVLRQDEKKQQLLFTESPPIFFIADETSFERRLSFADVLFAGDRRVREYFECRFRVRR